MVVNQRVQHSTAQHSTGSCVWAQRRTSPLSSSLGRGWVAVASSSPAWPQLVVGLWINHLASPGLSFVFFLSFSFFVFVDFYLGCWELKQIMWMKCFVGALVSVKPLLSNGQGFTRSSRRKYVPGRGLSRCLDPALWENTWTRLGPEEGRGRRGHILECLCARPRKLDDFPKPCSGGWGRRRNDQICTLETLFWLESGEWIPQTGARVGAERLWQQFQRKSWWLYVLMDCVYRAWYFSQFCLSELLEDFRKFSTGAFCPAWWAELGSPHFYCECPLGARSRTNFTTIPHPFHTGAWALRAEVWVAFRVLGCGGPSFLLCRTLILVQSPGALDLCSKVLEWGRGSRTCSH